MRVFYALNHCYRSFSEICGEMSVKDKLSVNIEQVATVEILSIMQGFLHSVGVLIWTSLAAILYSWYKEKKIMKVFEIVFFCSLLISIIRIMNSWKGKKDCMYKFSLPSLNENFESTTFYNKNDQIYSGYKIGCERNSK